MPCLVTVLPRSLLLRFSSDPAEARHLARPEPGMHRENGTHRVGLHAQHPPPWGQPLRRRRDMGASQVVPRGRLAGRGGCVAPPGPGVPHVPVWWAASSSRMRCSEAGVWIGRRPDSLLSLTVLSHNQPFNLVCARESLSTSLSRGQGCHIPHRLPFLPSRARKSLCQRPTETPACPCGQAWVSTGRVQPLGLQCWRIIKRSTFFSEQVATT